MEIQPRGSRRGKQWVNCKGSNTKFGRDPEAAVSQWSILSGNIMIFIQKNITLATKSDWKGKLSNRKSPYASAMEEHGRTAQPKSRATPNAESKKEKGYHRTETGWVTASDQSKVTPASQLHVTPRNTVYNIHSSKFLPGQALYDFSFLWLLLTCGLDSCWLIFVPCSQNNFGHVLHLYH